ncbi:MAG: tRNA lysidine(34) synthetase TilS, partial [Bifidobacteriaceae bacterium]|nr:tRNA lysidine(34) synthetase TilS [Bifidobacteriaceae bacterium]
MSKSFKKAFNLVYSALFRTITETYFAKYDSDIEDFDPELPSKDNFSTIGVAVSGGADSLALAAVTKKAANARELKTLAIIIDHQMQKGSSEVARKAAEQCRKLGFDTVEIERVDVNVKEGGPEAAARRSRYEALERIAKKNNAYNVFLGHTLNDQAETVLLSLARGSGTAALGGMREYNGIFFRPFLSLSREETEEICKEANLEFFSDPTNGKKGEKNSTLPLRSQVRNTLIPQMKEILGKDIEKQLAKSAAQIAEDDDCLNMMADEEFEDLLISAPQNDMIRLSAENLEEYPKSITTRFIKIALEQIGMDMSRLLAAHISNIADLIYDFDDQKALNLPGTKVSRIG